MLKEFEEKYIQKMYISTDAFWGKYNGNFPDAKTAAQYDDMRAKCLFLREFFEMIKLSINYTAVTAHSVNKVLNGADECMLFKKGRVRESLFSEQVDFLTTIFDEFKKINASYLVD